MKKLFIAFFTLGLMMSVFGECAPETHRCLLPLRNCKIPAGDCMITGNVMRIENVNKIVIKPIESSLGRIVQAATNSIEEWTFTVELPTVVPSKNNTLWNEKCIGILRNRLEGKSVEVEPISLHRVSYVRSTDWEGKDLTLSGNIYQYSTNISICLLKEGFVWRHQDLKSDQLKYSKQQLFMKHRFWINDCGLRAKNAEFLFDAFGAFFAFQSMSNGLIRVSENLDSHVCGLQAGVHVTTTCKFDSPFDDFRVAILDVGRNSEIAGVKLIADRECFEKVFSNGVEVINTNLEKKLQEIVLVASKVSGMTFDSELTEWDVHKRYSWKHLCLEVTIGSCEMGKSSCRNCFIEIKNWDKHISQPLMKRARQQQMRHNATNSR